MRRLILIIPIAKRDQARDVLSQMSGEDCSRLFDPTLNASGHARNAATHCICNWSMPDDVYERTIVEFGKPKWQSLHAEGDLKLRRTGGIPQRSAREFVASHGLAARRRERP
jgi:hypothetical protein